MVTVGIFEVEGKARFERPVQDVGSERACFLSPDCARSNRHLRVAAVGY